MAQRAAGKDRLIKCEFCGEEYSATYRRCPFCNGDGTGRWDAVDEDELPGEDYDVDEDARGGKRLLGGFGGGGYNGPSIASVLGAILSLALIAAAVCIVITVIKPLLGGRTAPVESQSPEPTVESTVAATQAPEETVAPVETPDAAEPSTPVETPAGTEPSAPVTTAAPVATTAPNTSGVTGFSLSKEDFSFFTKGESYRVKVTFQPAGSTAAVTWKSADANIATVDANGLVTAVGKGTVKVTASVEGVGEKECIVRCSLKDADTPTESKKPAESAKPAASDLSLNRTDFTLLSKGETFRMKVTGTDAAVTWKSSNPDVATIDSKGLVTAVGNGTCTLTATVDGQTLECIARCRF